VRRCFAVQVVCVSYFLVNLSSDAGVFFFYYLCSYNLYMMCIAASLMLAFLMPNHQVMMILFGVSQNFWWTFNGVFIACASLRLLFWLSCVRACPLSRLPPFPPSSMPAACLRLCICTVQDVRSIADFAWVCLLFLSRFTVNARFRPHDPEGLAGAFESWSCCTRLCCWLRLVAWWMLTAIVALLCTAVVLPDHAVQPRSERDGVGSVPRHGQHD
jgi:hypothetical protein